mmetsp:Transcript_19760/g.60892  ORF Transcript_19760/g.60892 Transcript_19760/m.60892 type:complete len:263 (+) Transcript_19760:111-899(+)
MTLKFARNANANGAAPAADDGDGDALEDSRSTSRAARTENRRVAQRMRLPTVVLVRTSRGDETEMRTVKAGFPPLIALVTFRVHVSAGESHAMPEANWTPREHKLSLDRLDTRVGACADLVNGTALRERSRRKHAAPPRHRGGTGMPATCDSAGESTSDGSRPGIRFGGNRPRTGSRAGIRFENITSNAIRKTSPGTPTRAGRSAGSRPPRRTRATRAPATPSRPSSRRRTRATRSRRNRTRNSPSSRRSCRTCRTRPRTAR